MINLDLLKTMKKNCIIINAARGGMINENDLDQALNERTEPELNVQQGEGIPEGELLFFSSFVKKNYLGEMLGVKSKTGVLIDLLSFSANKGISYSHKGNKNMLQKVVLSLHCHFRTALPNDMQIK